MPFINAFGGEFGKIMADHHGSQHVGEVAHGGSHPGVSDHTPVSPGGNTISSRPAPAPTTIGAMNSEATITSVDQLHVGQSVAVRGGRIGYEIFRISPVTVSLVGYANNGRRLIKNIDADQLQSGILRRVI